MAIDIIGLDADDTLWHSESFFRLTQARFAALLAPYADEGEIDRRLVAIERRNLAVYGYGAKGFTLSMVETALELGGDDLPASVIGEIVAAGREILAHPVEPLEGVPEALAALGERGRLVLITKGDLFHQEAKLAASGLGEHFAGVEIVSEKDCTAYDRAFRRHGGDVAHALMAGNSVKSDILPVLQCGGWAAHIPYPLLWEHERADAPEGHPRFRALATLAELPGWVDAIRGGG